MKSENRPRFHSGEDNIDASSGVNICIWYLKEDTGYMLTSGFPHGLLPNTSDFPIL